MVEKAKRKIAEEAKEIVAEAFSGLFYLPMDLLNPFLPHRASFSIT